jgi:hypothetical protein
VGWRESRPRDQTSQDTIVRRSAQCLGHCGQAGVVLKHYFSKTARGESARMPTATIAHDRVRLLAWPFRNLRIC